MNAARGGWLPASVLCGLLACTTAAPSGGNGGNDDGGGGSGTGGGGHSTSGESWTFLVYMVADNNLEPFGLTDLAEMAQVGSTRDVQIVVQVDRAAGYSADGIGTLQNWEGAKRLLVGRNTLEELEDLGEPNMGDAQSLADFIEWGVGSFPSDRYALILWDHGGAWPGFGGDESTRDHDLLDLAELGQAIDSGLDAAGLDRFALLGFDACLMSTFEVAATLEPYAEYLLASEELEPGHGWDYRELLVLARDPTTGPRELGEALISGFAAQAEAEGTSATITLALVDLTELPALTEAVAAAAGALTTSVRNDAPTVGRQRNASLKFGEQADPTYSTHMVDLGDLLARLAAEDPSTADAREQVRVALRSVVVASTAGATTGSATGLSVYFPPAQGFYNAAYDRVPGMDGWRDFLRAYFGEGQAGGTAPLFTNPDKVAATALDASGLTLQGSLAPGTGATIAEATLRYGLIDTAARTGYVVGDAQAAYDSSIVQGIWDLTVLTLTQGAISGYGYLSVSLVDGGYVAASIPFAYLERAGAEPQMVLLRYVFDQSGQVVQATYYLITEAGPGELAPVAGAQLYPLILTFSIDDPAATRWLYGTDQPLDLGADFQFGTLVIPQGQGATVYADLTAIDVGGNGDMVFAAGAI